MTTSWPPRPCDAMGSFGQGASRNVGLLAAVSSTSLIWTLAIWTFSRFLLPCWLLLLAQTAFAQSATHLHNLTRDRARSQQEPIRNGWSFRCLCITSFDSHPCFLLGLRPLFPSDGPAGSNRARPARNWGRRWCRWDGDTVGVCTINEIVACASSINCEQLCFFSSLIIKYLFSNGL